MALSPVLKSGGGHREEGAGSGTGSPEGQFHQQRPPNPQGCTQARATSQNTGLTSLPANCFGRGSPPPPGRLALEPPLFNVCLEPSRFFMLPGETSFSWVAGDCPILKLKTPCPGTPPPHNLAQTGAVTPPVPRAWPRGLTGLETPALAPRPHHSRPRGLGCVHPESDHLEVDGHPVLDPPAQGASPLGWPCLWSGEAAAYGKSSDTVGDGSGFKSQPLHPEHHHLNPVPQFSLLR